MWFCRNARTARATVLPTVVSNSAARRFSSSWVTPSILTLVLCMQISIHLGAVARDYRVPDRASRCGAVGEPMGGLSSVHHALTPMSMVKIASDTGLLEAPVPLDTLVLAPGDRAEIIVDTSDGNISVTDEDFGRVLELRADRSLPTAEHPPEQLATIKRITNDMIDRDRTFVLDEVEGGWGINGPQMDMTRIDQTIDFGATERWTITAQDGIHTFHTHRRCSRSSRSTDGHPHPRTAAGRTTCWSPKAARS